MYQMKMLSQLGTDRLSDGLLELPELLFATKKVIIPNGDGKHNQSQSQQCTVYSRQPPASLGCIKSCNQEDVSCLTVL